MRLLVLATTLLLMAFAAPHAAATECPGVFVWASDEANDSYDTPANLNGGMDILEIRVGEGGSVCNYMHLGITVNDPNAADVSLGSGSESPDGLGTPATQRFRVELYDAANRTQVQVHFVWSERTAANETVGWWVEVHRDGRLIADTTDGDSQQLAAKEDAGAMDAYISRELLNGIDGWKAASARADEWFHNNYQENGGVGYQPDRLDAVDPYTFGYGIGVPPVEEPVADSQNETVEEEPTEPAEPVDEVEPEAEPEPAPAQPAGVPQAEPAPACMVACPGDQPEQVYEATTDKQSPGPALPLLLTLLGAFALRRR